MKMSYPEAEKLNAIGNKYSTLREFIDWLEENGLHLCEYIDHQNDWGHVDRKLWRTDKNLDHIVLKFMEVDPMELERERRAILEEHRQNINEY